MKKLISMLAVLTMIFSLFATIPAYAETPDLSGTFSVDNLAQAVTIDSQVCYKFNKPVTDAGVRGKISAKITYYYTKEGPTAADPFYDLYDENNNIDYSKIKNDGGTYCEWDETYQYLTFKRSSSDGPQNLWYGGPGTSNTWYGRTWMVTLMYTENGTTQVLDRLIFVNPTKKKLEKIQMGSVTVKDGHQITHTDYDDTTIKFTFDRYTYPKRGENIIITVKKNGNVLTPGEEYTSKYTTGSITFTPKGDWELKSKYEISIKIEATHYDKDKNKTQKSIYSGGKEEETFTFYTRGYVEPDPEEPGETIADYTAAFENGAATITNNTDAALTDAMLVLTAKNGAKLTKVKTVIPFSLAAGATSEAIQCFELANGETFDFFIWNRATLQPILNK